MFVFRFVNLRTGFMNHFIQFVRHCFCGAISALALVVMPLVSQGAIITYSTTMSGPNENPANASPGTGIATVVVDDVARTMRSFGNFTGLTGLTTNAHIHAPVLVTGGNAAVATQNPILTSQLPLNVQSGTFDFTLNMALASSYNAAFVTANGNTPTTAGNALFSSLAAGTAYFNIHTSTFTGGEIRGFLTAVPEPSSMLLSGLAVFGLGVAARYRRKRKVE